MVRNDLMHPYVNQLRKPARIRDDRPFDLILSAIWPAKTVLPQAEQAKRGISPADLSVAAVLRAFRRLMRDYLHPTERQRSLSSLLRAAVRDKYARKNKSSRDYPRKKHPDPPAGPPEILNASSHQIRLARELRTAA